MGFFSWECRVCGHSILSPHATSAKNRWMYEAVVVAKNGDVVVDGCYDGYGRVGELDLLEDWRNGDNGENHDYVYPDEGGVVAPEIYHRACVRASGICKDRGPSRHAFDQGYFFDEEKYDLPEPRGE